MNSDLLFRLLQEGENDALDYKRKQYAISRTVSDTPTEAKQELVKDILSLGNSWRDRTAYILIGVQEGDEGQPATVTGLDQHLDDADIQQLISPKLNRPLHFSYSEFSSEYGVVGVVEIPVQERPFFVTKPFGGLLKGAVYVRRGSSTAIADADEVARMGRSAAVSMPTLEVVFSDRDERTVEGPAITISNIRVTGPEFTLPKMKGAQSVFLGARDPMDEPNNNFPEDVYEYAQFFLFHKPLYFAVVNHHAKVAADDVRLELSVPAIAGMQVTAEAPHEPSSTRLGAILPAVNRGKANVQVWNTSRGFQIEIRFGKVQPGATVFSLEPLFIGGTGRVELVGTLFADNISPSNTNLTAVFDTRSRLMTSHEYERHFRELIG